jgi:hypothetical protein
MEVLNGCIICATGIKAKEEKEIRSILSRLGGKYSPDFNTSVTHLIAKEPGSQKYNVGSQYLLFFHWS